MPLLKVIHITGIIAVLMSLGGLVLHVMNGGTKKSNPHWYRVAFTHGFGMAAIFASGLMMLFESYSNPWPGWVHAKMFLWLWFGGIMTVVHRRPKSANFVWWGLIAAGAVTAGLVFYKPF